MTPTPEQIAALTAALAGYRISKAEPGARYAAANQPHVAAIFAALDPDWTLVPTAEVERLRTALEGMVQQFAYWSVSAGGYHTGGLSALETAFDVLGWDDPHPAPEARCDEPGCKEQADCGWPTRPGGTGPNGGYRWTCGNHYRFALAGDAP